MIASIRGKLIFKGKNDAVLEAATNLMNELFCNPKQASSPEPVQSCTVLPDVVPHNPLKSQTAAAEAQDEFVGNVWAHAGRAGGCGAGVLLNVRLQFTRLPALAPVLLSCMQSLHVPLAF